MMNLDLRAAAHGALAGIVGAACMTAVRSAARRFGVIDRTVPQVLGEQMTGRAEHQVLDEVLHLSFGAMQGALYGAVAPEREKLGAGLLLGAAAFVFGSGLVLPLSGSGSAPWKRDLAQNAVDMAAHLAFGIVTEMVRADISAHASPPLLGSGREG